MLLLLNSAVMPTEGVYTLKRISEAAFQKFLQEAAATGNFQSYIGYPETARLIEQLTGVEIQVSREQAELATGDVMLIVKLRHRIKDLSNITAQQPSLDDVKLRHRIKDLSNITAQQPSLDDLDFFICHWHPLNEGES